MKLSRDDEIVVSYLQVWICPRMTKEGHRCLQVQQSSSDKNYVATNKIYKRKLEATCRSIVVFGSIRSKSFDIV